jgi:hypothetical protein
MKLPKQAQPITRNSYERNRQQMKTAKQPENNGAYPSDKWDPGCYGPLCDEYPVIQK